MSTVRTNTLSNAAGSASVPVDTVISGSAKAWVNFNGTGTVAIRASFNVSSITDNGVGDYTVNFTTAMPDANYSGVVGGSAEASAATFVNAYTGASFAAAAPSASAFRFATFAHTSAAYKDVQYASVAIFR